MTLSDDALRLAEHIVHTSETGLRRSVLWLKIAERFAPEDMPQMVQAAFELQSEGYLSIEGGLGVEIAQVRPEYTLYWRFDPAAFKYDSNDDAATLIRLILEDSSRANARKLDDALDWSRRRFNPAYARIVERLPANLVSQERTPDYPRAAIIMMAETKMHLQALLQEIESARAVNNVVSAEAVDDDELILTTAVAEGNPPRPTGLSWFLSHPNWTGIGVIVAIILGVYALYSPAPKETTESLVDVVGDSPVEGPRMGDSDESVAGDSLTDVTYEPAMTIPYDPNFLGRVHVPLPNITNAQTAGDLLDGAAFDYIHFSIAVDERRGLALYTAANVDRSQLVKTSRKEVGDQWQLDPRVPRDLQRGEDLYRSNQFDRGHLVRYVEVSWGSVEVALSAAQATQNFVNTVPQLDHFNRRAWRDLEVYVLSALHSEAERFTVFTGPVHRPDDWEYRGARIPRSYWKVIAVADPGNDRQLFSYAFLMDQYQITGQRKMLPIELPTGTTFEPESYQVSVTTIEQLTPLRFGVVKDFDLFRTTVE